MKNQNLRKLLAVALSVTICTAVVCTTIPASAEETNLFGRNGSFETGVNHGWYVNDFMENDDTLTIGEDVDAENAILMTKGPSAIAGTRWTSLASPLVAVTGGSIYKISFDLMGTGTSPYYILTAVYYNADKMVNSDASLGSEGAIPADWETRTAAMTIPETAAYAQLRIVFQGAAGATMSVDNVSINPVTLSPSLSSWDYASGYNDPNNVGISDLALEAEGRSNAGSVHIVHSWANDNARATVGISNLGKTWVAGETYVFSAWVKGRTYNPEVTWQERIGIELGWNFGTWAETNNSKLIVSVSSADWTQVSYEFTCANAGWQPIIISAGGYSDVDCYLDDVVIYKKGDATKTNKIDNGIFATPVPDTATNLMPNGDMQGDSFDSMPGFTGSGSLVTVGAYTGNNAVRITSAGGNVAITSDTYKVGEGDTVTVYGYYKTETGIPNAWIGRIDAAGAEAATGLHPGEDKPGETFTDMGNGWTRFERVITVTGYKQVKFLYGMKDTGSALFDDVGASIVCNVAKGDTNADGKIDVKDMVRLKKYILDQNSVCISSSSDFNADNTIDATELVTLRKNLLGMTAIA